MRFSEALGRKVVSLATAETVGLLDEFVVDPRSRRVVALGVKKSPSGSALHWDDIESFGPDAVTVSDADKIAGPDRDVDRLSGKDHHFLGKRVLLTVGDEVGQVDDVEFDPNSGELIAIVLAGGDIDANRLVGVGSYAVVVRDA
jgi:sporulation protein YlmC with PRC-barrel domain